MMEEGLTALSVEIWTNSSAPTSRAASAMLRVPKMLFLIASQGLSSISGTCLWAAAWMITSGLSAAKMVITRSRS